MKPDLATEAIEAERAQIGHEIHDSLLPLIFAASAYVQRQVDSLDENDPARVRLCKADELLREAMHIGRDLLKRVYPPELINTNWSAAVKDTVDNLADGVTVEWQLSDEAYEYTPAVAATAYRVIVEAIRNAVRHGNAKSISVIANDQAVTIVDDGSGFDPESISNDRYGIRCMKGRAKTVGGNVSVESKTGGPTSIRFELPSSN